MSERLSVIAVSCFEIARRDANVYFLFRLVVGSAGCHFGCVYDALGKSFFSKWAVGGFFAVDRVKRETQSSDANIQTLTELIPLYLLWY
jgi:hypothetical protein